MMNEHAPGDQFQSRDKPWYCVRCGAERPMNPGINCPTPYCNTRSSQSYPVKNPVRIIPPVTSEREL